MGVLGFWVWSLYFWNMSFFVFVLDAIFCGTIFFNFQDTVWLVKKSWWVHCCYNHRFYWLSDRCGSGFALWWSLSERSCRHKLLVSTSFWSWLLNVSSVLTSLKYTATFFGVLVRFWVHGSTRFLILVFIFLKYVFFVFVLDAIFCGTIFFSFFRTLCG